VWRCEVYCHLRLVAASPPPDDSNEWEPVGTEKLVSGFGGWI